MPSMLHSVMITTGRGGIVLYRRSISKPLNQPRMIAGLVTAMCEFSMGAISLPVATVELESTCLSLVELPVDDLHRDKEFLRAVVLHDSSDVSNLYHRLYTTKNRACAEQIAACTDC